MFDHVTRELKRIEASVNEGTTRADVFRKLRVLSLSDFGVFLISLPNPDYPKLSSLLPRMADEQVQKDWTGNSGLPLLIVTTDFVRSLAYNFARATGRSLDDSSILDFGCGYGRILRLMYYFTNEDQVFGVDPWDRSLEICRADGLDKNMYQSEYLPNDLPIKGVDFDLIFAFSVFTHTSERSTIACINTLAKYLRTDGVLAITIRPVEYWRVDEQASQFDRSGEFESLHHEKGFAFMPHVRSDVDGDVTYGDTSMSLEWLASTFPQLKIVGTDRSLTDPYQIYVFLQKVGN